MKKFICLILILATALLLFSCSKDEEIPENMQLVSTDNVAYRFYVPKAWTVNSTEIPSAYFSATEKSNVSVTTTPVEDVGTLADYWTKCDESYKAALTNYQQIGEVENVIVDEKNAIKCVYEFKLDGTDYKVMQAFVGNDGYIYSITYTSPKENYDLRLDEVNNIISVFKFR